MSTITTPSTGLKKGDARWFFGMLLVVQATAADTGGRYSLVEVTVPPNAGSPLHVHHLEEEGFYVLEGSVTLYVGDEVIEAGPGDFANGPAEVPHRFDVGPEGARMIWVLAPGGFEDMVEAVSVPAEELTTPPPHVQPPADAAEIIKRYGNELV